MNLLPPEKGQPDTRPRFSRVVHVAPSPDLKRPKIETRHREAIIAPGKQIKASDRTYWVDKAGSVRRVHQAEDGSVALVSRRSKAKPASKAQARAAAKIEAGIAKRERKRAARVGTPWEPPREVLDAAKITEGDVTTIQAARAKGLTGDPYADQKRIEGGE